MSQIGSITIGLGTTAYMELCLGGAYGTRSVLCTRESSTERPQQAPGCTSKAGYEPWPEDLGPRGLALLEELLP